MNQFLVDLQKSVDSSGKKLNRDLISRAWEFADTAHHGQLRLSGDPFISHPTQVAKTLVNWGLDTETVIAGLLHDTIEDGGATRTEIINRFGLAVANLVDGVTKVTDIHLKGSRDEEFVENLRKMILVMAKDLRVVLVKLADRLHNMQTISYLSESKQRENSLETLEIYAPLAERLGINGIKGQLEDLAFPCVYPNEYQKLYNQTQILFESGSNYLNDFRRELLLLLKSNIPSVTVNTRKKHLYSLFKKLMRPEIGGDISKVYDLTAARILVNTISDCYQVLGLLHGKYHPVPYLGITDFIANPKPNGYRSLHTKVFGPQGRIVEIQIRTYTMHEEAEMGIAAHWNYSEAKSKGASDKTLEKGQTFASDSKLSWVKQLAGWQSEIEDKQEYLQAIKFDAFQHRNLVFYPKGDVYDLPRNATPIDYAYAVHTDIGHQVVGAKVNGKLAPLSQRLNNGDVVELSLNRNRKLPNHEWLSFVVTAAARRLITKALHQS